MLFVTAVYFWFWTLSVLTKADIIQNHLGIKTTYKYVSNVNNIPDNNLEGNILTIQLLWTKMILLQDALRRFGC